MIYTIVGLVGVFLILLGYFLVQINKINAHDYNYLILNFFGAMFLSISLIDAFNWSALVINAFWGIISLVSIIKKLIKNRII